MPITNTIDTLNGIILEVWTGEVSATDLAAYWKQLLTDPEALAIRRTLVDLRDAHILFSGEELYDLIRTVVEPMLNGTLWHTALLVADAHQFGVSRQYQSYATVYSSDAIFYDKDAALKWLLQFCPKSPAASRFEV
ncbi:MAG TPA: hypothetical protein VIT67_22600 [Povalibacter sp.]